MADFTGKEIRNTYQRLLQLDDFITQNGTGSINLKTVHLSGSLLLTGSQVISEDLHVLGNVTAQQFITTTVSSSIIYQSGSTQFGDTLDDTHSFTGSLNLTGSVDLNVEELKLEGTLTHTGSYNQTGDTTITGSINQNGTTTVDGTIEGKQGIFGTFFANPQTINNDSTLPSNYNSRIFGPITVAEGKTLTVGLNSKLEIIDI